MRPVGRARCNVCTRPLTQGEIEFLDSDVDFLEHHGHYIGRDYVGQMAPFLAGDRVRIIGGFEDGIEGVIVANEPMTAAELQERLPIPGSSYHDRPYRYRVDVGDGDTIGGLHPFNLELLEEVTR